MSNKILVNCAYGADNIEKATVAFIVASASAASDNETVMFLTGEAVRLATEGGADGHQAEGYQPVKEFLDATIENGGSLWVCPACAGARGIGADVLIAGAELAGAARTIGFLNDGGKTIM